MDTLLKQKLLYILEIIAGPGNRWRTIFLVFLLCNYKNLPFVWHIRFFTGGLIHSIRPKAPPKHPPLKNAYPLFLPVITSTHAPLTECDFNIHKSNSTYFSDLDVSRAHLIFLLCSPGIPDYKRRRANGEAEGALKIGLGGVACFFLREIKPYDRYELWTRVLCWDQKWVYTVTHFVRKGAVRPEGFLMSGGGLFGGKKMKEKRKEKREGDVNGAGKKDIFAFAISKYVFKYGRRTVPPELVFERCGQLPPRPADSKPASESTALDEGITEGVVDVPVVERLRVEGDLVQESLEPAAGAGENESWTWEKVEEERKRGILIAEHLIGLDKLREEFTGDEKPALGNYRDVLWA